MDKTICNIIKSIDIIRFKYNMSIEELCLDIIHTTSYWRYLNGKRIPDLKVILKLISRLDLTILEFIDEFKKYKTSKQYN